MERQTGEMDPGELNSISDRGWIVILILGLVAAVVAVIVAYAILKASDKPAPTLLVMSLSMLTLLAVVAFVITGSQEMGTLAGVGLGALAAAVSSMFGSLRSEMVDRQKHEQELPPVPVVIKVDETSPGFDPLLGREGP